MIEAIALELQLQKDFLEGESISSIYFGGGTPSLLTHDELELLLSTIKTFYAIESGAEITLEANPDDLDAENLRVFYQLGINRLSIGIQTFDESQLLFLNRAHNATGALDAFHLARKEGYKNISIDLIYGIPSNGHQVWQHDLDMAIALGPEHISSYCLTIEPNTVFGHRTKKGKMLPVEEEYAAVQFEMMIEAFAKSGYEQYEISNFCKPGFYSRHNSNYWRQQKYLGVGPGAHSFNKINRQFNCSSNAKYLQALSGNIVPFETDMLDEKAKINEYLMTGLRTKWGCDLRWIKDNYNVDLKEKYAPYLENLLLHEMAFFKKGHLILTNKGKLLADKITGDLFLP